MILKGLKIPDKVDKFYENVYDRGFKDNTIVTLKILSLLHKYLLCGPPPNELARKIFVEICETWSGINFANKKNKKDEYRSDYFSKLIDTYSDMLIAKVDIYSKYKLMISQNFSLNSYFKNKDKLEGSPLSIKVIRNLFNYWNKLTNLHPAVTQSTYLRKIMAFVAISILEEEYPLVCLIVHLYQGLKLTAFINNAAHRIQDDVKRLDEKFIENYSSLLLFYHKVIRMPELEDVRTKLPYFPHELLKHFKVNSFLNNIELKGHKSNILTFINNENSILGLKLPDRFKNDRLIALSEFHDFNCQYEPFRDFEGGEQVLKDCMYPMPTLQTLKQILPSKKLSNYGVSQRRNEEGIRVNFDEDNSEYTNLTMKYDEDLSQNTQGQGEEISLTDECYDDLQKLLETTNPNKNRGKSPYGVSRRFQQPNANLIDTSENLLDLKTRNNSNRNSKDRNSNRSFSKPHSGRNMPMRQANMGQNSFLRQYPPPNNMPPRANPVTPQNAMMGFPNLGAQIPPNMNHKFNNIPPMRPNLQYQKSWNSASRGNPNFPQNAQNMGKTAQNFPKKNEFNNLIDDDSGFQRQSSNGANSSGLGLKMSEGSTNNNYITEDWFAKLDNDGSNKATANQSKDMYKSTTDKKEDSFLLSLVQDIQDSDKPSSPAINSDLIGIDLALDKSQSKEKNNLINLIDPLSPVNNEVSKESTDIRRELNLMQQKKEIEDMKNQIEEQKRMLEKQQKDFEQIKYAEHMRIQQEAKKLHDQANEINRLQQLDLQRKQVYQELELKRKQELENKREPKKVIEDYYILKIEDIKIEKCIGEGGSAKVYKGTYKEIDVAIKRLNMKQLDEGKAKQEFKREVNTLMKIRHPNLVLFMGVAYDASNLCIVTEF